MINKTKLSPSMTEAQFENGYWYAVELKDFAKEIGIPSVTKLRKDEIEKSITHFLRTGKIKIPTKRDLTKTGPKDVEIGLSLKLPVINYTSNKETKKFIVNEAKKIAPNLKEKSGVRYRLNRWREEQLTAGTKITYKDLIKQYIKLNQTKESFSRIPSSRYINFLSDFSTNEAKTTKPKAVKAWKQLKKLDIPKTYKAWKNHKQ